MHLNEGIHPPLRSSCEQVGQDNIVEHCGDQQYRISSAGSSLHDLIRIDDEVFPEDGNGSFCAMRNACGVLEIFQTSLEEWFVSEY
jgi:hypothetical protein